MAKKKTAKKAQAPKTPKTANRLEAALYVVAEMKKPMTFDALVKACDAAYVKAGGTSNPKESKQFTNRAILAGTIFGYVEQDEEGRVSPAS